MAVRDDVKTLSACYSLLIRKSSRAFLNNYGTVNLQFSYFFKSLIFGLIETFSEDGYGVFIAEIHPGNNYAVVPVAYQVLD